MKDAPGLVFYLQSKSVYMGGYTAFKNVTDLDQVYGAHRLARYQEHHYHSDCAASYWYWSGRRRGG